MKLNPNFVFIEKQITDKRVVALQGGTRSGKTYSVLQWIIRQCVKHKGMTISIVRETLPALKSSAMRDFFEILQSINLYSEAFHNKSENTYILNDNLIEFFSIDSEQKIRGRKRDLLFVNEANEISIDKWRQLLFRTTGRIIIDFNPSMFDHWIYDHVLTREDCGLLITTYKDNPFLSEEIKRDIERLEIEDPEYYKVFGLGQRGQLRGLIFNNFTTCDTIPTDAKFIGCGLDFGFTNDPTAALEVYQQNGELWVNELLYTTGLTNSDIFSKIRDINKHHLNFVCDSAEPKSIEELRRMGMRVEAAKKGRDSIRLSIDVLRRYKINITKDSTNLLKEIKQYKLRTDKDGKTLNEPVDFNNHEIDALRYIALNKLSNPSSGKYAIAVGKH